MGATTIHGEVIASRLCISAHTLRNHLLSIHDKLGVVQNRLGLHALVTKHHLERPPGFLDSTAGMPMRRIAAVTGLGNKY